MKFLLSLLLIAAAAAAGYLFEPRLRHDLTGTAPAQTLVAPIQSMDLSRYAPEQLPEKILLKSEVTVSDPTSGLKMKIDAGNRVQLVRLEGDRVIISPGAGNFSGSLPIAQTDLTEQLSRITPSSPPGPTDPLPPAEIEMPPIAPAPAAEPPPQQETVPAPAEAPAPLPLPESETSVAGDSLEATPAPATEEAPKPAETVMTPVIMAMQQSLKNTEISEFTYDQVREWVTGPDEEVKGTTFHTGLITCETTTIFGAKEIQAKAYILDDKVIRWVWPKSGAQIK